MEVLGLDLYNQCITGEVAKTLNAIASDSDHIPCVLVIYDQNGVVKKNELSDGNRFIDG